jgi:RNA polymerase sigma-70 factor (ECF subfamily)
MAAPDRLEEIYRQHAPALFRFLIRLTGDEAETKDALQEIFVRLAKSPALLEDVASPRSYLFRLAHRLVIDRYRRQSARRHYEEESHREGEPSALPEPSAGDAEWLQKLLASSLDALPPEQKAVVVLKIWEEMTFAQIAEVLEIPANTAASRYRYALDKLHTDLRPLHGDLP